MPANTRKKPPQRKKVVVDDFQFELDGESYTIKPLGRLTAADLEVMETRTELGATFYAIRALADDDTAEKIMAMEAIDFTEWAASWTDHSGIDLGEALRSSR